MNTPPTKDLSLIEKLNKIKMRDPNALKLLMKHFKSGTDEEIFKVAKFMSRHVFFPWSDRGKKFFLATLLEVSIRVGNLRITKLLFKKGAKLEDIRWLTFRSSSLQFIYNTSTRKRMLFLLLKNGLKSAIDDVWTKRPNSISFFDFFSSLVRKNDHDVVELAEIMVDSGIFPEHDFESNYNALTFALESGNIPLMSFIINKGVDINRRDWFGFPLYEAVEFDSEDTIDYLISRGAEINAKTHGYQNTTLHAACNNNNHRIISLLIRKGANIDVRNWAGETPFSKLDAKGKNYHKALVAMIKEFSKLNFENVPILESDMHLIQNNSDARKYFDNCVVELKKMSETFWGSQTFYSILKQTVSIKKLANLSRNVDLLKVAEDNLCKFTYYESDLQRIFDQVIHVRDRLVEVESRLQALFGDFLPNLIIRELADYLTVEDLPLE